MDYRHAFVFQLQKNEGATNNNFRILKYFGIICLFQGLEFANHISKVKCGVSRGVRESEFLKNALLFSKAFCKSKNSFQMLIVKILSPFSISRNKTIKNELTIIGSVTKEFIRSQVFRAELCNLV